MEKLMKNYLDARKRSNAYKERRYYMDAEWREKEQKKSLDRYYRRKALLAETKQPLDSELEIKNILQTASWLESKTVEFINARLFGQTKPHTKTVEQFAKLLKFLRDNPDFRGGRDIRLTLFQGLIRTPPWDST